MDKDNELLDLHIDALHKKSRSELIEILKKIESKTHIGPERKSDV